MTPRPLKRTNRSTEVIFFGPLFSELEPREVGIERSDPANPRFSPGKRLSRLAANLSRLTKTRSARVAGQTTARLSPVGGRDSFVHTAPRRPHTRGLATSQTLTSKHQGLAPVEDEARPFGRSRDPAALRINDRFRERRCPSHLGMPSRAGPPPLVPGSLVDAPANIDSCSVESSCLTARHPRRFCRPAREFGAWTPTDQTTSTDLLSAAGPRRPRR